MEKGGKKIKEHKNRGKAWKNGDIRSNTQNSMRHHENVTTPGNLGRGMCKS
jgi:hypothetical protein